MIGSYKKIKPDIVFNCSHIHGPGADFPVQVAAFNGIPTSVFLFSWDNLTSRGRIFLNMINTSYGQQT